MEEIQLFLNINTACIPNDWHEKTSSSLSQLISSDKVQIIGKDVNESQISISYNLNAASLDEIQRDVEKNGGKLTDINIHFTSGISGVSDPYGASGISISVEEKLKKIRGVLGSGISSNGIIKVRIDISSKNKQMLVEAILKTISSLNPG